MGDSMFSQYTPACLRKRSTVNIVHIPGIDANMSARISPIKFEKVVEDKK